MTLNINYNLTRMTIFIKAKLKKSNNHTNIEKFRVTANVTEYHIISKSIFFIIIDHHSKIHDHKAIISRKNVYKNV